MIKRIFDFSFSLFLLIFLSPVLIIISIIVFVKIGRPIIFSQLRPGINETIFKMYKFRSMSNETDSKGNLLSDSDRLSSFGSLLRKSSLDELPSLFNILNGDMSFVGPRPLLVKYLPFYTDTEKLRHTVRPGLTGLAQINGRNNLSWNSRLNYDVFYVNNQTITLDFIILLKTFFKVISRKDIVSDTSTVMKDLDEERNS